MRCQPAAAAPTAAAAVVVVATAVATAIVAVPAGDARAEENEVALVLDATMLYPRDGYAESRGVGAEVRFLSDREPLTMSLGGFAAIGQQARGERGRDVFDLHFQAAAKIGRARLIVPYAGLGFDVLHVTTHELGAELRGTTLGVSAQLGFLGTVGSRLVWRATAGYLGAITPGTGDDLGGVFLQLGLGVTLDD